MNQQDAAHSFRLAQARRFLRYCDTLGVDPVAVTQRRTHIDLTPISDDEGHIVPEQEDFESPN